MASPLCVISFSLNQILSDKCHYSKYPLHWNMLKRRLESEPEARKLLTPFNIFNVFHQTVIVLGLYTFLIIYEGIFRTSLIGSDALFFLVLIHIANVLCVGLNVIIFYHGKTFAEYANSLLEMSFEENEADANVKGEVGLVEILKLLLQEVKKIVKTGKGDFIGVAVNVAVLSFALGAILIWFVIYFGGKDAFSLTRELLVPSESVSPTTALLLRLTSTFIGGLNGIEVHRTYRLVFATMLVLVHTVCAHLKMIQRKYLESGRPSVIKEYSLLYHVHFRSVKAIADLVQMSYQCGTLIVVLSLSVSFVGWKFLSLMVYMLGPFMGSLSLLIVSLAVGFASTSYELSSGLIRDCAHNPDPGFQRGYMRRVVATLRPAGFPVGVIGDIDKDFKLRMWTRLVENTQDTILMVASVSA